LKSSVVLTFFLGEGKCRKKNWIAVRTTFAATRNEFQYSIIMAENQPNALLENILTLKNLVSNLSEEFAEQKPQSKWSIKEHVGHLLTIESLWIARLDDFALGKETLRPWNGTNADTDAGEFNKQRLAKIFEDFESIRQAHVKMIEFYLPKQDELSSFHEGKQMKMTLRDHLGVMANHDLQHIDIIKNRINQI
jgi:uncharacterized damage-inducible protein DinB